MLINTDNLHTPQEGDIVIDDSVVAYPETRLPLVVGGSGEGIEGISGWTLVGF